MLVYVGWNDENSSSRYFHLPYRHKISENDHIFMRNVKAVLRTSTSTICRVCSTTYITLRIEGTFQCLGRNILKGTGKGNQLIGLHLPFRLTIRRKYSISNHIKWRISWLLLIPLCLISCRKWISQPGSYVRTIVAIRVKINTCFVELK